MMLNYLGTPAQGQGYSGSIEQTILALDRKGVDVRVMTFNRTPSANVSQSLARVKSKPFQVADVGIIHSFPNAVTSKVNKFNILYTMFETDKLPTGKEWAGIYGDAPKLINEYCDLLFVPCNHNVELFRSSGVTVPIEVIPNGINPRLFNFYDRSERPKDHKFTFFMHGTLTLRKNPGMVIASFANLFKNNPNVRLVLKTQSGTLGHVEYIDMGDIQVIDKLLPVKQIVELMQQADAYLFPTRGEGFGIPPLEAMATGLPTVIAGNTGMLDYSNPAYNITVPTAQIVPAERYPAKWGDVGNWYDPDYYAIKDAMKWIYENQNEARDMGKRASKWVLENWTYDQTADKIIKAIKKHYPKWQ